MVGVERIELSTPAMSRQVLGSFFSAISRFSRGHGEEQGWYKQQL